MFGWFNSWIKKKNVVPETKVLSEEDLLKQSIETNVRYININYKFRDVASKVELIDKRFECFYEDINEVLYFSIVNEKGEKKYISKSYNNWPAPVYINYGVWDKAFNSVLVDMIEKCKVLKTETEEKEKMEKKIKEESFNKLFQEEI